MGSYLVGRWLLLPLALLLLPVLWRAFITFLEAVASLFSKHAVHRRAAYQYFLTLLFFAALGASAVFFMKYLPEKYQVAVIALIVVVFAVWSLVTGERHGGRSKKQIDADIDATLAEMRKRDRR